MGAETAIPMLLVLILSVALFGSGLISIEDTRTKRLPSPITPQDCKHNSL